MKEGWTPPAIRVIRTRDHVHIYYCSWDFH